MSFLDQYDATPDAEKWGLVRHWLDEEALPFVVELLRHRPVLAVPAAGTVPPCTLVARFDEVIDVLRRSDLYSVALYKPKMGDYLMAQDDDNPDHSRDKSVMSAMLNRRDIPSLRAWIGQATQGVLADAGGGANLVQAVTRRVPALLVCHYMGYTDPKTEADSAQLDAIVEKLLDWSLWNQWDTFHNQPFDIIGDPTPDQIHANAGKAAAELAAWVATQLLPARLAQIKTGTARDDVVTRLLATQFAPGVDFSLAVEQGRVVVRNIIGLLIGSIETTSQAAAQALQEILRRPAVLAAAREAAVAEDPTTFDAIVWEALRFVPISPYLFRMAESDSVIGGVAVPKGTILLPLILGAMFDPAKNPEPLKFSPGRPQADALHFGFGLHECMGKAIGMVLIPEILRQCLRLPSLAAEAPISHANTPFPWEWPVSWQTHD